MGEGVLTIIASETLSFVPATHFEVLSFTFAGVSGASYKGDLSVHGPHLTSFNLKNAELPTVDSASFNITLTPAQRAAGIFLSGTPGGKGTPAVMDIDPFAFQDVALNKNDRQYGIQITEIADTTPPSFISATLNYSTGLLVITLDEILDLTPLSKMNLSKFNLHDANVAKERFGSNYFRYPG